MTAVLVAGLLVALRRRGDHVPCPSSPRTVSLVHCPVERALRSLSRRRAGLAHEHVPFSCVVFSAQRRCKPVRLLPLLYAAPAVRQVAVGHMHEAGAGCVGAVPQPTTTDHLSSQNHWILMNLSWLCSGFQLLFRWSPQTSQLHRCRGGGGTDWVYKAVFAAFSDG